GSLRPDERRKDDEETMLSGNPKTLLLAAVGAAALIGGGVGAGTVAVIDSGTKTVTNTIKDFASPSQPSQSSVSAQQTPLSLNALYRKASPGVVEITVTSQGPVDPFGDSQQQQAQGSGFVYDLQGHIVTDEHVVDGAQSINVKFPNGGTYHA